ncbi:DUF6891 domain-containing protein [Flavobacterium sp. '19STA2R22 D10 B1']|uniref:DUF6891 domain-containing protein n=1 Tax=Flavobacterium aerium TaxID=3037261 RepID=UPI00278C4718|nr:hypothetical protein [Flavobacterium sp. '19STA2R22 D10 B1']
MTENETFIYESIFDQVRMGFLPIEEIKEIVMEQVEDNKFEDEISEEWVNNLIDEEYQKLIHESEKWDRPTDTERLIKAFDELAKINITALHNAGFTTSDGEYEVVDVENELIEKGVRSNGYCFYHEQDLARAIQPEDSSLYLAFQKIDNSEDEVTIGVGRQIVKVLQENGFTVEWGEIPNVKILIPDFKWRKTFDKSERNLLDYREVIRLMTI